MFYLDISTLLEQGEPAGVAAVTIISDFDEIELTLTSLITLYILYDQSANGYCSR